MVVPTLNGNESPSQPRANLDLYLAIPARTGEGMSEEDWTAECDRMFRHSRMVQRFVNGEVSPQDFEDSIADLGLDPYQVEESWDEGNSLLY
jgi:hypothetical protein